MNEQTIFTAALERPPGDRAAFLDDACGADRELRERVEKLLSLHDNAGSFLEPPAAESSPTLDQPIAENPGTVIGRYKLLEQIGEGGFGTVFMAEQEEPVRRKVALKIIKPGMDTREVIARFEAERQALAIMDHPNIAKVLDAGATESGRPFFVMELVRGVPITSFCDQNRLTTRERLELFASVCEAVQHAHQKGIIHRDIKPSNVLVTLRDDRPVPKVIDFGVAKATNQRLTEKTLFTRFAQMVGTPLYMSPEQAGMSELDIDTRSDIYSLGVLLYELLTGTTPFDQQRLREAAYDEFLRIIREEEPPKPSLRISTLGDTLPSVAAQRQTEPKKLSAVFRGELDWIVMKALEKDRTRRYETAHGFAGDIERYLNDEPVEACPPSVAYRLKKFARRNKVAFSTAALVAVALLLGIAGTTLQAVRATKAESLALERYEKEIEARQQTEEQRDRAIAAEKEAKTAAAISQAVNEFLNQDLLQQASPDNEPDRDIKLRTVVDRAAEKIKDRFADQPMVEATIRETIGETYFTLGEFHKALEHRERALKLREQQLGREHPATLQSMMGVGCAIDGLGRSTEAEKLFREVLEIRRRLLGPEHPDTLSSMYHVATALDGHEATRLHREVLEIQRRVLGPEHPSTLRSMNCVAGSTLFQGHYGAAEKLHREVLEIQRRVLPPECPDTLASMHNLAVALQRQGRYAESEEVFREVFEAKTRVLGPEHPGTLNSMMWVAVNLKEQGRHAEAEKLFREVLEIRQRVLGPEHPATLGNMADLATAIMVQGRCVEAERLYREALEIQHRTTGQEDSFVLPTKKNLAIAISMQDRFEEAEKLLREVLETERRTLGDEHPDTLSSLVQLAGMMTDQGSCGEAEKLYREVLEISRRVVGPEHPITLATMNNLAIVIKDQGQIAEAEKLEREVLDIQRRVFGVEHPNTLAAVVNLAITLKRLGDKDTAEKLQRDTLEIEQRVLGAEHPRTLTTMHNLANTIREQGRHEEAETLFREVLEIKKRVLGPEHSDVLSTMYVLANTIREQGRHEEAETLFREVLEIQHRVLGPEHPGTLNSMNDMAVTITQQGRNEEAEKLFRELLEIQRRCLGFEHPETRRTMHNLAGVCTNLCWKLATAIDVSDRDPAKAVELAYRAIELKPDEANHWNNLGVAQYRLGDWQAAVEALEKADAMIEGGDRIHRMFLAMAHWQVGNKEKARELYAQGAAWIASKQKNYRFRDEAEELMGIGEEDRKQLVEAYLARQIENQPGVAQAWIDRANWHQGLGAYDKAINDYNQVIRLVPNDLDARTWRKKLAFAHFSLGQWDEAINAYSQVIRLVPNDLDARTRRGQAYTLSGAYEKALDDLNEVIRLDPSAWEAYLKRATAYKAIKDYERAIADASEAIRQAPTNAWTHQIRGEIYHDMAKYDLAIACYRQAIEVDPNGALYGLLGIVLKDQQKLDEAILCFRQALELDPKLAWVHEDLGDALRAQGKWDEVIAYCRQAIELDPKDAWAHVLLGDALLAQGKSDEVIAYCRQAIELDPKDAWAHVLLGDALKAQGKLDEAIECYRQAIEVEPKNVSAWLKFLDVQLLGDASAETAQSLVAEAEAALGRPAALEVLYQHSAWNLSSNRQAEYESNCREIAAQFAESTDPRTLHLVARVGALANDPAIETEQLVQMARRSVEASPAPWHQHTLGLCLLRDRQEQAAIEQFNRSLAQTWGGAPLNWLGLAIAHSADGRVSESQEWLKKAQDWIGQNPLDSKSKLHPHDRIACQLLLREAEQLIGQASKSSTEDHDLEKRP